MPRFSALVRWVLCLTAMMALSGTAAAAATPVDVYPFPGSGYELPATQIAFRGIPASQIGTVTVVGSKSGAHAGSIVADSDGDGGSFVMAQPFLAGETVSVSTSLNLTGAPSGKFSFQIATVGSPLTAEKLPLIKAVTNGLQHFVSRPDLVPAAVDVTNDKASAALGDIFVAPQNGPSENGPMILNPQGRLVWFDPTPVSDDQLSTDFRVQELYGQPVLTWWQGFTNNGSGRGEGVIFNSHYQLLQLVRAAEGLSMDLHEFLITNGGQAYFIGAQPVSLPGVSRPVADSIVQEIDLRTGLVLFDWNALDHVPLSQSILYGSRVSGHVLDPFHVNSVAPTGDGSLLISARNTSAIYKVDRDSGQTIWTLGGKSSSFKIPAAGTFALQHDVEPQADGSVTLFDDGAGPPRVHASSNAIRLALNTTTMTASVLGTYNHSPAILADFEGSAQALPGGDVFIGWGQQPYFSESTATGQQDFDAHFAEATSSYRAYRFPWSTQPVTQPAIGLRTNPNGTVTAYGSWNGATDVSAWRGLSGVAAAQLTALATRPSNGFETGVTLSTGNSDFQIQALGAQGQVLATSPVTGAPQHVAVYGRSAFVSSSTGGSGIPVGCFALKPCQLITTVTSGTTVLARSNAQTVGANRTGIVYIKLSTTALSQLARAGHMSVTLNTLDQVSHRSATVTVTLIRYSTSGAGPKRSFTFQGPFSVLGETDFVSSNGIGGILSSCTSPTPCQVHTTVTSGATTIATPGTETEGPRTSGYISFTLNAAGKSLLSRAPGHQLSVNVSFTGPGIDTSKATIALVPFS